MTFLETMKEEICENPPKQPCCRRTLLLGILAARGKIEDGGICVRLTNKATTDLVLQLIKEQFGRQAESIPQKHGGRIHTLGFSSNSAERFLVDLESKFLTRHLPVHCKGCATSFLRGLFLASGHMTDPFKGYHLELSLGERAEAFMTFLQSEFSLSPKLVRRRGETLLYWKESEAVEEFMTRLGLNEAVFRFINCKIEKQFRNEANRRTNCEAGNITRSVTASSTLVSAIRRLEEENLLSSLPDELSAAARLRLEYPEASLSHLAAMSVPPITKSGMNHRLQKVLAYAQKRNLVEDSEE